MTVTVQNPKQWRRVACSLFVVAAPLLLLGLLTLIAISPIPMQGAKIFGGIANAIKGHPRATAYWALAAGVSLWLIIGGIIAAQELRREKSGAA